MSGLYLNMDDFQNIDQAIDALDQAEVLYDPRGGTSGDGPGSRVAEAASGRRREQMGK